MRISLRIFLLVIASVTVGRMLSGKRDPSSALRTGRSVNATSPAAGSSEAICDSMTETSPDEYREESSAASMKAVSTFEETMIAMMNDLAIAEAALANAPPDDDRTDDQDYSPSPELLLALARYQEQHGARDQARKQYERLLADNKRLVEAIIGLARLDALAGRAKDAERGFRSAVNLEPRSGLALDSLGQFYVEQQRWDSAVETLLRAMSAAPKDATVRFHYANALASSGNIAGAYPLLVETVGSAVAHYNIGLVLHDQGDLASSEHHLRRALTEKPELNQARYWLEEVRRERAEKQPSPE